MSGGVPALGSVWEDADRRELTVSAVVPADRLGREVRGSVLLDPEGEPRRYSCTLAMWASIWRDRAPRAEIRQ